MNITIQEPGTSAGSATINWTILKDTNLNFTKIFGAVMGTGNECSSEPDTPLQYYCTYERTADIAVKLFVENEFKAINISKSVQSINDVLFIVPVTLGTTSGASGTPGKGINTSPFNIRILSKDLFKLEVNPQTANLGRLYKTDTNLFRSGDFEVKVTQQENTAPRQSFILPLEIAFQIGQLSLTTNRGCKLKTTMARLTTCSLQSEIKLQMNLSPLMKKIYGNP
ncbi:hypothetical protein HMI78_004897 [Salmonella enterica]|nr:hypothetical protein [Salmonella enterica]